MRMPSIEAVAKALRIIKHHDPQNRRIDVRLRVFGKGSWQVLSGDPSNDNDHGGLWVYGSIAKSTNCTELASELLAKAKEYLTNDGVGNFTP